MEGASVALVSDDANIVKVDNGKLIAVSTGETEVRGSYEGSEFIIACEVYRPTIEIKEKVDPKNIKCFDPCSGSGHILIYMFELLYQIYESYGYIKKDICELILRNNLYGLDIDDRAGQLSVLSIVLKAREYDKNIFNNSIIKKLNIMSIQETNSITN